MLPGTTSKTLTVATLALGAVVGAAAATVVMTRRNRVRPDGGKDADETKGGGDAAAAGAEEKKGEEEEEGQVHEMSNGFKLKRHVGRGDRPVRVWMDGCFDLMHFGHANAFRQGKALGDVLVVGLNFDEEIIRIKGPPIMTEEERAVAVGACRFVDELVRRVPYVLDEAYLQRLFTEFEIDLIVHGDDPCLLPDGSDVFATAKAAGRFRVIKRTEGVSTTEICDRMLKATNDHFQEFEELPVGASPRQRATSTMSEDSINEHHFMRNSHFLPTARRINQFSSGKTPQPGDKIVYISGAFDLFHAGHISTLELARGLGDFLIVGVHGDHIVNKFKGGNYPILNLHERVLSVLACKYVDEVIIGAPFSVDSNMVKTLGIDIVACGEVWDTANADRVATYRFAQEQGLLRYVPSRIKLTAGEIVARVKSQEAAMQAKVSKKGKAEKNYEENQRVYVAEL